MFGHPGKAIGWRRAQEVLKAREVFGRPRGGLGVEVVWMGATGRLGGRGGFGRPGRLGCTRCLAVQRGTLTQQKTLPIPRV